MHCTKLRATTYQPFGLFLIQSILNVAMEKFGKKPDAVIGIHGRFTDYGGHLKLRGARYAGKRFYKKAIEYFRLVRFCFSDNYVFSSLIVILPLETSTKIQYFWLQLTIQERPKFLF